VWSAGSVILVGSAFDQSRRDATGWSSHNFLEFPLITHRLTLIVIRDT